ncbi:MAG: hypothetical protein Q4B69_03250 [Slackia sp.]|nr:hypothetical protein [Slackia sp.]
MDDCGDDVARTDDANAHDANEAAEGAAELPRFTAACDACRHSMRQMRKIDRIA